MAGVEKFDTSKVPRKGFSPILWNQQKVVAGEKVKIADTGATLWDYTQNCYSDE